MNMADFDLGVLKKELREEAMPFFSDSELDYYFKKNNNDLQDTIYECLILKSESTGLSISGLSTVDTSSYFKRLASRYRKSNSGNLGG